MEGSRLQGGSLSGVGAMEGHGGIAGWGGLVQRIETTTEQVMEDGGGRWGPKVAILHKNNGEEYSKNMNVAKYGTFNTTCQCVL